MVCGLCLYHLKRGISMINKLLDALAQVFVSLLFFGCIGILIMGDF